MRHLLPTTPLRTLLLLPVLLPLVPASPVPQNLTGESRHRRQSRATTANCGLGLRGVYWPDPSNITVCWLTRGYAREKLDVQMAVQATWQRHSKLTFRNWGHCYDNSVNAPDIRIKISNDHPHTLGLGSQLRRQPDYSMSLNFEFDLEEFRPCQTKKDWCIRVIAVHEFGHAIGLAHEHHHPQAPEFCKHKFQQGTPGNDCLTEYDLDSVMNYCNPTYANNGVLSIKDKITVSQIYCGRSIEGACHDGTRCMPFMRCNGNSECADGSDERNCPTPPPPERPPPPPPPERPSPPPPPEKPLPVACRNGFQCMDDDQSCLRYDQRCDGRADCWDRSDEFDCPTTTTTTQPPRTASIDVRCLFGYNMFRCRDASRCVPISYRCDGDDDCADASDEEGCF